MLEEVIGKKERRRNKKRWKRYNNQEYHYSLLQIIKEKEEDLMGKNITYNLEWVVPSILTVQVEIQTGTQYSRVCSRKYITTDPGY